MRIEINTDWIKVMNGIGRGYNQPPLSLNDLIVWSILSDLKGAKIPLYRSIVASVLCESNRTISRRFKTLKDLGILEYRFYKGVGHYKLKVNAKYDFGKFLSRYQALKFNNDDIDGTLERMAKKLKLGTWNNETI